MEMAEILRAFGMSLLVLGGYEEEWMEGLLKMIITHFLKFYDTKNKRAHSLIGFGRKDPNFDMGKPFNRVSTDSCHVSV